jgi:hypothetical protein
VESNFTSLRQLDLNGDSRQESAEKDQAVSVHSYISESVSVSSIQNEDKNETPMEQCDESSAAFDSSALSIRPEMETSCSIVDETGASELDQGVVKGVATVKSEQSADEEPVACEDEAVANKTADLTVTSNADACKGNELPALDSCAAANNDVKLQINETETEVNVNLLGVCHPTMRESDHSAALSPHPVASGSILVKCEPSEKCSPLAGVCQPELLDNNDKLKDEDSAAVVDSSIQMNSGIDDNKTEIRSPNDRTQATNDTNLGTDSRPSDVDARFNQLMNQCIKALELCLARFPQHYKSVYRLAYIHFHSLLFKVGSFLIALYFKPKNLSALSYFNGNFSDVEGDCFY